MIEDVDGNRFLDFNAGIAVTATGHCHPHVVDAIERQAARAHPLLLERLVRARVHRAVRTARGDRADARRRQRVFLGNSGTEAVEAAIKLARHATGRPNLIAFHGAFHGRSLGSLSLTASKARYRGGFGPLAARRVPRAVRRARLHRARRVPAPHAVPRTSPRSSSNRSRAKAAMSCRPPAGSPSCARLCDAHGILLVVDEVQSGVGRTGRMWAIEHEGVEPDVLLAGKGLASGLPLSAVIARGDLMRWEPGMHGSTFGGNPVACAAALATLDLVEGELTSSGLRHGRVSPRAPRAAARPSRADP